MSMSPTVARRLAIGLGIALITTAVIAPAAGAANAKTKRVSVKAQGIQATGPSRDASVSASGRFVAFASDADDLVANDGNERGDIFVRDRKKSKTRLVSKRSSGTQGTARASDPSISGNGRYVAFQSLVALVGTDTNNDNDIYVHDRKTKKTKRVSVKTGGAQATDASTNAAISSDGRYGTFQSRADDLIGNDGNGSMDVFVHDRQKGKTRHVSMDSNETQSGSDSYEPEISANGRWVSFIAEGDELSAADTNGRDDIYVRDRKKGKTKRVTVPSGGNTSDKHVNQHVNQHHDLSGDGRIVAFDSTYAYVGSDTNDDTDVYTRGPLH
jgi:Tol biopolymer transport system component